MASKHKFLNLNLIEAFVPMMEKRGVSVVARSSRGFLSAYQRAEGSARRLSQTWRNTRDAFIARHMAQLVSNDESLYDKDGTPTRRHLALIAWAFSPDPIGLRKIIRLL
jgi:hypothetical protein